MLAPTNFYSTLPNLGENPIDYWIRLNKAADVTEEGLKQQGRLMDNMGGEIAKMFVKHCPDPEFASVFKYKQIHKWTPKEIQMRVDEYQREQSIRAKGHIPLSCLRTNYRFPLLCSSPRGRFPLLYYRASCLQVNSRVVMLCSVRCQCSGSF
ncbi:hypothetical protein N1851_010353 [Merluccius polli]|uniref:Uncharacterized protein n=1 Tax=Merluccius polli TaxID=89951 RepID=A0AA47MZW3_MERPO|nr:hypothetical protein N1851_010353 [Merluccius polli]